MADLVLVRGLDRAMTIAYLDQNAASYLALAQPGSQWHEIRSALAAGFLEQRIVCPMPLETLVESAPCDRATRTAIEDFFHSVSGGTRFRAYSEILVDKTLALVRADHEAVAFAEMGSGWAARDEAARDTREFHSQTRDRMIARIQTYNFPAGAEDMTAEQIFRSSSLERCGMLWRDLQKFVLTPATPATDYETPWLMSGLIAHELTGVEAQQLSEAVRFHHWEPIFVNFFDLMLGSRWDHDSVHGQRRYKPNDEIDRWRAAVALAHSDLFITDSGTADLCRRAIVADYTPTVVFSTKQADEILQFLHERA